MMNEQFIHLFSDKNQNGCHQDCIDIRIVFNTCFTDHVVTADLFDSWAAVISRFEKGLEVAKISMTFFASCNKAVRSLADLMNKSGIGICIMNVRLGVTVVRYR